jgi:hypothetical protein
MRGGMQGMGKENVNSISCLSGEDMKKSSRGLMRDEKGLLQLSSD